MAIDDTSVSLIGVISLKRSSSTFLVSHVLGEIHCHITLNEIFFNDPYQSGDTWVVDGKFLNLHPIPRRNSPAQLAQFLVRAAKRKCRDYLGQSSNRRVMCGNHCWVNWKEFDDHFKGDYEFHGEIWKILQPYDFKMVVLERPVEDRWPSFWYAKRKGDWNTKGDKDHKEALATAEIPEMTLSFRKLHERWFSYVRNFLESNDGFSWMNLTFDQVVKQDVNLTRQLLAEFLSTPP